MTHDSCVGHKTQGTVWCLWIDLPHLQAGSVGLVRTFGAAILAGEIAGSLALIAVTSLGCQHRDCSTYFHHPSIVLSCPARVFDPLSCAGAYCIYTCWNEVRHDKFPRNKFTNLPDSFQRFVLNLESKLEKLLHGEWISGRVKEDRVPFLITCKKVQLCYPLWFYSTLSWRTTLLKSLTL